MTIQELKCQIYDRLVLIQQRQIEIQNLQNEMNELNKTLLDLLGKEQARELAKNKKK